MKFFLLCLASFILSFCKAETKGWQVKSEDAAYIHRAIKKVTDVSV